MTPFEFKRIEAAFRAADQAQDVTPLTPVLDPDVGLAATRSGPGNCHSREEVLGVWQAGIAQGIVGHIEEFREVRGRVLFVLRRDNPGRGRRRLGTHVLSVHQGMVTHIQDYLNPKEALEALEPRQAAAS